jgi:hypothetical protein
MNRKEVAGDGNRDEKREEIKVINKYVTSLSFMVVIQQMRCN